MTFPRQVPGIPLRSPVHELETDVVYAEVDGVPLRYDHYRPLGTTGPVPAVVFVHGGGWTRGDPSQAAGNALHLVRRGVATIAISYRLAPAHRFPAPLDDVRRGLRWVRAHADALGIDADRLTLLGLSAGAHLVMLAHLAGTIPELAPDLPADLRDVPETVRAVVAHYGPYDLGRRRSEMVDGLLGPRVEDPAWARLAHRARRQRDRAGAAHPRHRRPAGLLAGIGAHARGAARRRQGERAATARRRPARVPGELARRGEPAREHRDGRVPRPPSAGARMTPPG